MSLSRRLPAPVGTPAYLAPRSFNRKGTPRNGPSGRPPAPAARAWSYIRWTTALIVGFPASMRARAASSSSLGVTSLFRTSSARPRPSCSAYSAKALMRSPWPPTTLLLSHPGARRERLGYALPREATMTLRLSVLCATTVALLALAPVPAGAQSQEHDAPGRRGAPPPPSPPAAPPEPPAGPPPAAPPGG